MKRRTLLAAAPLAALARPVRAADPDTVAVGGIQLPTNAPLFIALDRGFFDAENVRVTLTWFTAAASVFSAVVSRDLDVGTTSSTAATFNLAARGGFRIVGGTTRDAPHFPLNGVLASNRAWDAGFRSLDAMANRSWAMTTAGSTHHYDILAMARARNVPADGLRLVPLESYGNISAALSTGQVDGAILPPALVKRAVDAGTARFLAWTGDEVPMQQGVVCASPQTIAARRPVMARFMRAYARGAAEYNRAFNQLDPAGTPTRGSGADALVATIARGAGITPAETEAALAFILPDLRPDETDIRRQVATWQDAGLVGRTADFSNLFDLSLLPA